MSTISSYDSGSISALFSSLGNSGSTGFSPQSTGFDLGTYSSIRNGSYRKLLNAYYAKTGSDETGSTSKTDKTETPASKQKNNAATVRDAAQTLNDSVDALNKRSLWEKKRVTGEDGSTTEEYDKDAIYEAVSSFVEDYNALVDSTGSSSDHTVLRTAANMVNYTRANKEVLAEMGITIGKNNKLEINETTFKNSDMAGVKSAFYGAGSYAKRVAGSASMVYGAAVSQLAKLSTTSLYSNNGKFSYMTGSTFNRFL